MASELQETPFVKQLAANGMYTSAATFVECRFRRASLSCEVWGFRELDFYGFGALLLVWNEVKVGILLYVDCKWKRW